MVTVVKVMASILNQVTLENGIILCECVYHCVCVSVSISVCTFLSIKDKLGINESNSQINSFRHK